MGARGGRWDERTVDDLIAKASRADIHATAQRSRANAAAATFAATTLVAVAALTGIWAWVASGSFGNMIVGVVAGIVIALWAVTGGVAVREAVECKRAGSARDEARKELKAFRDERSHDGGQIR